MVKIFLGGTCKQILMICQVFFPKDKWRGKKVQDISNTLFITPLLMPVTLPAFVSVSHYHPSGFKSCFFNCYVITSSHRDQYKPLVYWYLIIFILWFYAMVPFTFLIWEVSLCIMVVFFSLTDRTTDRYNFFLDKRYAVQDIHQVKLLVRKINLPESHSCLANMTEISCEE